MTRYLFLLLLHGALSSAGSAASVKDPTAVALRRCLDEAANASTAGQTACEAVAQRSYDRRLKASYSAVMHRLPTAAAQSFRRSLQSWLAFRHAEAQARSAFYATRQGTLYVPMEAGDATNIVRNRALQLEAYLRVLKIES